MIEAIIYHFPHEEKSSPIGAVNIDEKSRFALAIESRDYIYTDCQDNENHEH